MDFQNIKLLESLLKTEKDVSDSDDDLPDTGHSKIGPGHIGQSKIVNKEKSHIPKDPNKIWDEEEVIEAADFDENSDPRKKPEYDIKFRQAVTPEDLYLQMNGKTPATASCEDLVLTINLKGETREKVDLDVQATRIDIRSQLYRLGLPLPHSVDPNSGNAKWNEDTQTLTITLRIVREFDFLNF